MPKVSTFSHYLNYLKYVVCTFPCTFEILFFTFIVITNIYYSLPAYLIDVLFLFIYRRRSSWCLCVFEGRRGGGRIYVICKHLARISSSLKCRCTLDCSRPLSLYFRSIFIISIISPIFLSVNPIERHLSTLVMKSISVSDPMYPERTSVCDVMFLYILLYPLNQTCNFVSVVGKVPYGNDSSVPN